MRHVLAVLMLYLCSSAVFATTVYTCVGESGETVFAESPCGDEVQQLVIEDTQLPAESTPTNVEILNRILADKRPGQMSRQIKRIDRKKARYESDIQKYREAMEYELTVLRNQKRYIRNNLAGATLANSISREMHAVVAKYQGLISDARYKISALDDERRFILGQG